MKERLPIHDVIPELKQQLLMRHEAILQAAPGAGKTTVVPLSLLDEPWRGGRLIVMLEPRRIAAKTAAKRLADQLGEALGERVGYQIRQEGKKSARTQLLVVTEGILTRMLQDDPSLDEVALIIFDEFHERNLQSDLAFALAQQSRQLFRDDDPLKLLIMSATLDTTTLERHLDCQSIVSQGRQFPVEVKYANKSLKHYEIPGVITKTILSALREESGSILVFLPGQGEIRKVESELSDARARENDLDHVVVLPLYGNLSVAEQERVISPSPTGERKVVLATSVAQTSLTIEGIRVVIDSGLSREARLDANTATTRLHTRRVSKAESTQRLGRAGRTQAGVCYRWWSESQQDQLSDQAQPQIELEDLTDLVLALAHWGSETRDELDWITPPPEGHWNQAQSLLFELGVLTSPDSLTLTSVGQHISQLNAPVRLATMLMQFTQYNRKDITYLCALLYEGDPFKSSAANNSDIKHRLIWLNEHPSQAKRYINTAKAWESRLSKVTPIKPLSQVSESDEQLSLILTYGFPDRIAKRVRQQGEETLYKLSNGRTALLSSIDPLAQHEFIIVLELGGVAGRQSDKIYLASRLNIELLQYSRPSLFFEQNVAEWDKKTQRLIGEKQRWIHKLCVSKTPRRDLDQSMISHAFCQFVRGEGIEVLPWDDASRALLARIRFVRNTLFSDEAKPTTTVFDKNMIPDVSDTGLLNSLEEWLSPFLNGITTQAKLNKLNLTQVLHSYLPWDVQSKLESTVPERLRVASGASHRVDYTSGEPVLSVKLQEMFGETSSPKVLGIPVKIELLSPAQRPLAVTMDLAFFWKDVYPEVRKEMRGRYPKHPWPEDPLTAAATSKTNRSLQR
ncbi:ATP-dependent helicase HrpB [Marinomonas mediterranea]|uniref:ATP-dependent helicase HrpB n=1 Tax=Marinomonas mediterranea TaxID=119864 RepID=UPI00234963DE|nr:ATP-dependent helicase HrpB [Marinomonas mediterranea]WCN11086.1 ATP-dependent helicase HrpB [Marinomonas mediterranea]